MTDKEGEIKQFNIKCSTSISKMPNTVWSQQWGAKVYFSGKDSNSKGIAILINDNFNSKIINYEEIIQGRLQSHEL